MAMAMAAMPAVLILILITIFFWAAFLSLAKNPRSKYSGKLPSGNSGLPVIGETFGFLRPHLTTRRGKFMELHISRFGKIFLTNLFGHQTIVSADAEFNRFVLKNDMRLFQQGWPSTFNKIVGQGSISLAVGDAHKHMRSAILEFLSSERVRTVFLRDVDNVASWIMSSWREGKVFSAKDEATKFSLYIMVKKILSFKPGDHEVENLLKEFESFSRGFGSLPLYFPGTTYYAAFQSRENILKIFKKEIEKRKRSADDEMSRTKEGDFLGWLIKNTNFSDEKIGDMLLSLLFAGHDTTSRAISALIYFLHGCPSAIEQLQKEHLQVTASNKYKGESKFTWDDYKSLEFTKCVINETLRLSSISIMVAKKATEDVEFNGYVVPKDCRIMLHYKSVHLDPLLYKEPEQFNPWRWLTLSSTSITNNFMPFGGGVRYCPGSELARTELAVFLHHLILKYKWELAELDHPMNFPFMDFPKGLPIKVQATSNE